MRQAKNAKRWKPKLSIQSKLLLGAIALIGSIIVFMSLTMIWVFTQEKTNALAAHQAQQLTLASRNLVRLLEHALDHLRALDLEPSHHHRLAPLLTQRAQISHQELEFSLVRWGEFDPASGRLDPLVQSLPEAHVLNQAPRAVTLTSAEWELARAWLRRQCPSSLPQPYPQPQQPTAELIAFFPAPEEPGPASATPRPRLHLVYGKKRGQKTFSVALATLDLSPFAASLGLLDLTVADQEGEVLFAHSAQRESNRPHLPALTDTRLTPPSRAQAKASSSVALDFLFLEAKQSPSAQASSTLIPEPTTDTFHTPWDALFQARQHLGSSVSPGLGLIVLSRTALEANIRSSPSLTEQLVALAAVAICLASVLAIFFSRSLTSPLNQLLLATQAVSEGNFQLQLPEAGSDEIGVLAAAFQTMSEKITLLIQAEIERASLTQELAMASTIQKTLFPAQNYLDPRITLHSFYQPAATCSGDWWNFFISRDHLVFMMADATGHGFPSALLTASMRSCLSMIEKRASQDPHFTWSASEILSSANRVIFDAARGQLMMTLFVGILDFRSLTLTYGSAGHTVPWVLRRQGDNALLISLLAPGQRLGEVQEVASFLEQSLILQPQDRIFLATDGLTEGRNRKGVSFGKMTLKQLLLQSLHLEPPKVIDELQAALRKHHQGWPPEDDITLALLQLTPASTNPPRPKSSQAAAGDERLVD